MWLCDGSIPQPPLNMVVAHLERWAYFDKEGVMVRLILIIMQRCIVYSVWSHPLSQPAKLVVSCEVAHSPAYSFRNTHYTICCKVTKSKKIKSKIQSSPGFSEDHVCVCVCVCTCVYVCIIKYGST